MICIETEMKKCRFKKLLKPNNYKDKVLAAVHSIVQERLSRVAWRPDVDQTYARRETGCSEAELCSSPVSSLSVVPDFVVSLVSDPVWHWSVLLDLLGKSYLLSECLNGTLKETREITYQSFRHTIFLFINCY